MSVLEFRKRPSTVEVALGAFKDVPLETVLVIGRTSDKELHWTFGGEATISEAVGLLEVLKYEIIRDADGPQ